MTSEITTNVLLHTPEPGGHGAFVVSAFFYARCLRISVRCTTGSAAGGSPPRAVPLRPQSAHALAEHGRGLALVDALATTWGSEPGRPGQAVYFTVDWDPVDSASTERTPAPWTGFSSQAAGW
ncbi:ATP-binding protein [Nocardiopsis kunsanensis]|nr:ATP-binding protein [Nocardiopsis kunsanensis]